MCFVFISNKDATYASVPAPHIQMKQDELNQLEANQVYVTIPVHSNILEITRRLVSVGVLTHPWSFLCAAFLEHKISFEPGTYIFTKDMSFTDVIDLFKKNKPYKVTIPEGLTVAEIVRHLNDLPYLSGGIFTLPPEGTLLPETYAVRYGDSRESVIKRLAAAMNVMLADLWKKSTNSKARLQKNGITSERELLTLASIVEKETGVKSERAHVAAVFLNRLALNMRLQSDPTTSYAITNGKQSLGRALTKADLAIESAINTYTSSGLPPQPISCPGKASLIATLSPAESDSLYFVADGTGGHRFARNLDEHNKNVSHWRKVNQ
ncbi:MAG: endolytic transglycosylase MltG [Candidatus Paracaedibacteraceae bacterium]|nr:endolytic transglycosylase MltG [Candidatus Paracaedibacteraceae bacterium]